MTFQLGNENGFWNFQKIASLKLNIFVKNFIYLLLAVYYAKIRTSNGLERLQVLYRPPRAWLHHDRLRPWRNQSHLLRRRLSQLWTHSFSRRPRFPHCSCRLAFLPFFGNFPSFSLNIFFYYYFCYRLKMFVQLLINF